MKIGTDVNLDICKEEGYTMAEYDGRTRFSMDKEMRFFAYYPEYLYPGEKQMLLYDQPNWTPQEVWECYLEHKDKIDSFIGMEYKSIENEYDALSVMDSLIAYGIIDPE